MRRRQSIYRSHNALPVLEYRDGVLDADHYNRAQCLLNRDGDSLRLALPGLNSLDLILQRDAWVIVDRAFNDIPIAAWTSFDRERRSAVNAPVHCQVRLYHVSAGIIIKRVLEAMEQLLGEEQGEACEGPRVIEFLRKE